MYHISVDWLCIRLASGVVLVCNNRGIDPNYLHINIDLKTKVFTSFDFLSLWYQLMDMKYPQREIQS